MKKLEWRTERRKVKDLVPLSINPRKISEAKLAKLIEKMQKFNVVTLPEIDADGTLLSWHQRLKAMLAMGRGDEEIEVRVPNRKLSKMELKEWNLISNSHDGTFDFEALEADFMDIDFEGLGLEDLKMDFDAFVLGDLESPDSEKSDNQKGTPQYEAVEDDFEPPVIEEIKTDIVVGDLFEIGRHRLLCGSSTDKEAVEKLLNGEKVDLAFTDPPYGISIVSKTSSKVGGGGKTKFGKVGGGKIIDATTYAQIIGDDTTETAKDFYTVCKELGIDNYIIWGGNYFTDFVPPSMCWLVWDKKNTGNFADFEMAWTSFNRAARKYEYLWNGMSRQGSHELELKKRVHPTQKPVGLFINIFADFDFEICYDGFIGSGSTMVAAHQTNRKCYGMELSPNYCQVIIDRMRKLDPTLIIKKNGVEI